MSYELERLCQKVESGDKLSDAELAQLETEARARGGASLRTSLAQALINADAAQQALPMLEALRRDFPKDVQVLLALGRALISLERWSDAEPHLKQVMALNPDDPEALKALAVIALRRCEFARARALVDDVLRQDPFDTEAQQLHAELSAQSKVTGEQLALLPEFIEALAEKLRSQSTPHLLQREMLLVKLGKGGVARLDLRSLYAGFLETSRPLHEAVTAIASELAERTLGLPPGREALLAKVMPVLRDQAFLERASGAVHREGPAGLFVFYAVDDPELLRYVPEGALGSHRVTLEELDEAAWKNLQTRAAPIRALEFEQGAMRLSASTTGLWAMAQGDGHDAARVLTLSHQRALTEAAGEGPLRVYLGLRELVLVCREDDTSTLSKLEALSGSKDGIGGHFRLKEGRLYSL